MTTSPHNFMDNYGRPNFKLPYRWNSDVPLTIPLGPKNVHATSPYLIGVIDIRWDSPTTYVEHNGYNVLGVNVYRSYDTPEGPYTKLNDVPIGALYFRDETREVWVDQEDPVAGGRLIAGTNANGDWVVHTFNKPLIVPGTNGDIAYHPKHVKIDIRPTSLDNFRTVPAFKVNGETGEIFLINRQVYNHQYNRLNPPVLPVLSSGGEIRVSYSYINNLIKLDANRKIYYKCTTVAVDGSNDEIKETPLNEVDAVSLYDMEKIDWIWAESIRRNRWLLEQAGERVKLFIRKWAGEKCPCWDEQYRTAKNDCHLCFAPGTLVNTETGWKKIEDINHEDKVLSSDGKYHKVKGLMVSPYKGAMVTIESSVNTNPIIVTPSHPLLVLRGEHKRKISCGPKCNSYIEAGDGNNKKPSVRKLPSGRWWARVQVNGVRGKGRVSLGTYETKELAIKAVEKYKEDNLGIGHELLWDDAKNIKKFDWLTPQWSSDIRDLNTIRVPNEFLGGSKYGTERKGATEFLVDDEFLWVVGLYIAEGSNKNGDNNGGGSINFSLHKDEKEYQEKLISFFVKYGYNPIITEPEGIQSSVVTVNSTTLGSWFPKWLGHLCFNKHIPQEFMYLPDSKVWSLIKGIHDGDGSKRNKEITQTSEILALQLVELLHRVGEQPLVRRQNSKKLTPKGNKRRMAYCVSWAEDTHQNNNRKRRWFFKEFNLAQVKSIGSLEYDGLVYNIEVEEDPTYVVNGLVVHNCFGTAYIGGYEGPYDIIIAPPETEKTVQLMDMGLHISYDWNTWTGPYPLLNDRDFIVRQNNDRLSIAHVNPQGSRGAIYQQHFMLAPLDRRDPRYTVAIDGGLNIPAAWNAFRQSQPSDASPTIPNKPEIPDQYELRGRTVTFENIVYAIPPFIILGMPTIIKVVALCNSILS